MWAVSSSRANICAGVHISPVLILTGGNKKTRGRDSGRRKERGRRGEPGHSDVVTEKEMEKKKRKKARAQTEKSIRTDIKSVSAPKISVHMSEYVLFCLQ